MQPSWLNVDGDLVRKQRHCGLKWCEQYKVWAINCGFQRFQLEAKHPMFGRTYVQLVILVRIW